MRYMLYNTGEVVLDVTNECGTAGAGKKALFGKLLRLLKRYHIRTECSLDNIVEAELLHTGYNLTELSVGELAGDGGSNDSVNSVAASAGIITLALLEDIDGVEDKRLIHNSTEGTLVNASAALDTLIVVYRRSLLLIHRDSLYLASILTGTLAADDSGEGANLCTGAALTALGLIDMSHVIVVEADSAEFANVLTTVGKTSAAGVGNLVASYGTLVASDLNNLDNVGVVLVTAHSNLYSLAEYRSLLVYAATHSRLVAGNDHLGNIHNVFKKSVFPGKTCYFSENFIFQMLNFSVKFAHNSLHLLRNN